jgi:hypothetical protein
MNDEHFEIFIEEFGAATTRISAPVSQIEKWRSTMPPALLEYWYREGWSGFGQGIFWIANPDDFEELLAEWLVGTPLEKIDRFHVIARTAFGKLYLWGERTGPSTQLVISDHSILCLERDLKKPVKNPDLALRGFFSSSDPSYADALDEDGKPLFQRALQALGPLRPDEIYGFEPALVIGGKASIENVRIVKIHEHLRILRQLAGPRFPMGNLSIDKFL